MIRKASDPMSRTSCPWDLRIGARSAVVGRVPASTAGAEL
jgi:hypothetical protein